MSKWLILIFDADYFTGRFFLIYCRIFTPFMKRIFSLFLFSFLIFATIADAQQSKADSLYKEYLKTTVDTTKINLLVDIYAAYDGINEVKGLGYAREALELAERAHYDKGICVANVEIGDYYYD